MIRRALCALLAFAPLLADIAASPSRAGETVTVRAAEHDKEGYGRIALDWPSAVSYDARIDGDTLTIHFERPLAAKLDSILRHLDGYVTSAAISADGTSIVAHLRRPATVKTFTEGNTIAVDIVTDRAAAPAAPAPRAEKPARTAAAKPQPARGTQPQPEMARAEPPKISTAESGEVPIRFAAHDGFRRVVFDWRRSVPYTLDHKDGVARLRFERAAKLDSARLAEALPGLDAKASDESGTTIVTFAAPAGTRFRHFHSGDSVVLDVMGAGAMGDAGAAPPRPAVMPPPELVEPVAGQAAPDPKAKAPETKVPETRAPEAGATDIGRPRPLTQHSAAPPVPPGAMPVHFALAPQGASLRFDWPQSTPAAVFRRGAALWIVFAGAKPLDLSEAAKAGGEVFSALDQLPDGKATVLRMVAREDLNPSVRRAENSWVVDLKPQQLRPEASIPVEARPSAAAPSVFFASGDAAETLFLRDPEVGDTLAVTPLNDAGRGVDAGYDFVDFSALASVQGIVLLPRADDLRIARSESGIVVDRPNGLMLSSESDRQLGRVAGGGQRRFFDFAGWAGPRDQGFLEKRERLERAVAAAPPAYRSKPRLALARFYFANLLGPEAKGVLEAINRDDPGIAADPAVLLMTGAVDVLSEDWADAARELSQKTLDNEPEAALWRAALAVHNGDAAAAAHGFALSANLIARYPQVLRDRFALEGAEAFLDTNQSEEAPPLLQLVLKGEPSPGARSMAQYLEGRRALAQGEYNRAVELWTNVANGDDRPSRARALFALTNAQLATKRISTADAIKTLDGMRFAWRGDRLEFDLLRKLGELKIADGDVRGGFDVLREAASTFSEYAESKDVLKEVSDTFADIFLGKNMSQVSPIKALSLYEEFKDFAPVGERADTVVRRLVDRLVSVDLLDSAANLLDDQVNHRLAGRDKARVAAQLALLRLLDHKPDAAIKALDIEVDKDLPADLARQRQQLRARALAELNHNEQALAILANDTSRDADRLRADIFWRARNWEQAAKAFEHLAPPSAAKLDKEGGQLVLDWASALTLAGDQKGLADLRAAYAKPMAETVFADAFRVVAGDSAVSASDGDPRLVASKLAQVSELQSFMAGYKERLAKDRLSEIN